MEKFSFKCPAKPELFVVCKREDSTIPDNWEFVGFFIADTDGERGAIPLPIRPGLDYSPSALVAYAPAASCDPEWLIKAKVYSLNKKKGLKALRS